MAIDELRAGPGRPGLRGRPASWSPCPGRPVHGLLPDQQRGRGRGLPGGRGRAGAIVDWDVHHGNGTEALFWDEPGVLYVSTHQWPCYPGTGRASDVGGSRAPGLTLNVPLPPGATGDVVRRAFERLVTPVVEDFAPTWVLVSAGFDAHRADPLADLALTAGDFADLARVVSGYAPTPGRLVLFLEGGYELDALRASVAATLGALVGAARAGRDRRRRGDRGREQLDAVATRRREALDQMSRECSARATVAWWTVVAARAPAARRTRRTVDEPGTEGDVPEHEDGPVRTIVVGVDGSDGSVGALSWACDRASATGASVEAVTTWQWPMSLGPAVPIPTGYDPAGDAQTMLEAIVAPEADRYPSLTIRTRVVEGHPAEALVEASRHADLLVVGSRGHGGFAGMLLGSVSQHCAAHAACPSSSGGRGRPGLTGPTIRSPGVDAAPLLARSLGRRGRRAGGPRRSAAGSRPGR